MRSSPLQRLAAPLSLIVALACEAPPSTTKLGDALQTAANATAFPRHHTPPPSATPRTAGANGPAPSSSWTTNALPTGFAAGSTSMLLTDGRVMCQDEDAVGWWILTPDAKGNYVTGTWSQAASMAKARLYYASAVLMDGRVAVFGGEYISGVVTEDPTGEVYDPVQNKWSALLTAPSGWSMIGDAPNAVLPNGQMLVGGISDQNTAIWDPTGAGSWSFGGTKLGNSGEETWILLPDGSVLTVDCDLTRRTGKSELWVSSPTPTWTELGSLPIDIVDATLNEIGPAMLLADGRVMFFGGTGHTALYTPSPQPRQPGTWAAGPDIPADSTGTASVARDTPAVLLPNNHVLLTASSPTNGGWGGPTAFFDVDPTATPVKMTLLPAAQTPANVSGPPYEGRLLLLPSGEVMYTQGTAFAAFLPPTAPVTTYAPSITSAPTFAPPGTTFTLTGLRLNGLSQAVIYGDDESAATNYPLVRLVDANNNVFYARTHDHSTLAVATGTTPETTQVTIPASIPLGAYQMQVVANGVASASMPITISNIKPPTLALTSPASGSVSGTVAVNATAAPAPATTLTNLTLKIDGAQVAGGATSPQAYSWDTTTLANGSSHVVAASATDADTGAASASATVIVKNNPLVAFTGLADGGSVQGVAPIAATATAPNGTTLATLAISLDGVKVVSGATSPETYNWTTTAVANGTSHALVATATDVDGTTASTAIQVVVRNAPTVSLSAPADGSTVSGKVTVTAVGTALAGTTLRSLAISVDGAQVSTGATSPANYTWDTTALNNGSSHTVTATATDADGVSASATSTVTVQNNPVVAVTAPTDGSQVSGPVAVNVTGTAAKGTTLTTLALTIDGAQAVSGSSSPQTFTWDTRNANNGSSHVIVATATDQDGTTATATSTVTVENKPSVQITAPANGASVTGTVTLTASATVPTGTTLTSLSIAVDGTQVGSGTASPFSFSWSTAGLSGSHTLTAKAVDADGTNASSSTVTVTVGGSSGGGGGGKSGCGCGAGDADGADGAALGLGLLALLAALARRRALA